MFNLEQSIAAWRRGLTKNKLKSPEFLDELESHLRDGIEDHIRQGLSVEEAFTTAVSQLGKAATLNQEFNKALTMNNRLQKALSILRTPSLWPYLSRNQLRYTVLTLAGIPGQYADTSDRTVGGIEPRWATYFRSIVLMAPAVLFAFAAQLILMPKLKEIWLVSRIEMPSVLRQILGATEAACYYWWAFAASAVVVLALFEWRAAGWPRFRRAAMGISVFLLNICALLSLGTIGILALLAASLLMPHK